MTAIIWIIGSIIVYIWFWILRHKGNVLDDSWTDWLLSVVFSIFMPVGLIICVIATFIEIDDIPWDKPKWL